MYAGKVVETANAKPLYANPRMPYTIGLLNSIPRLDEQKRSRLIPIAGMPPDMITLPPGCAFEPRCVYTQPAVCQSKVPPLREVAEGHQAACPFDITRSTAVIAVEEPPSKTTTWVNANAPAS